MKGGVPIATALALCLAILPGCDSGRAEREYLKTVRPDFTAISSVKIPFFDAGSQSRIIMRTGEFEAAEKTCSDLDAKIVKAQARRKPFGAALNNEEVRNFDRDLDLFYVDLQKASEDAAIYFATIRNILFPMDRLTKALESLNERSEDKAKLLKLFQALKDSLRDGARDLEGVAISGNKTGLQGLRDMTAADFRKPLPIIDEMVSALNKNSLNKLDSAGKKFEEWGSRFEASYRQKADASMQNEIDAIEEAINRLSARNSIIQEKMSRLEGELGILQLTK